MIGKVIRFEGSFGFIRAENGQSLFVFYKDIVAMDGFRTLNEGDRVEFDVQENPRGLRAVEVRVI